MLGAFDTSQILDLMLDSLGHGVCVFSKNGDLKFANAHAHALTRDLGLSLRLLEWHRDYQVFDSDQTTLINEAQMPFYRALQGEVIRECELFLFHPETQARSFLCVTASPMKSPEDSEVLAIAILDNITDRKSQEDSHRKKDQLATLGKFAGAVAHEINNPLTSVITSVEAARNALASNSYEFASECLDTISKSALRCRDIVANMRTLTRQEELELIPCNPYTVIENALQSAGVMASEQRAVVSLEQMEDLPQVTMQPLQMEQVLINLIRNAMQSSPDHVWIQLGCEVEGGFFRYWVRDDGNGIPIHLQTKIFDPFYTSRYDEGGSGLGLSIVKGIVDAHRGTIRVESREGEGTTVWVELPFGEVEERKAE